MKILALEFSSPQRSVAVFQAPGEIAEVIETGKTASPLRMIEEALKQAGIKREHIECVAVGLGPGSYTGIRAALALAQGWQLATAGSVKLTGVSSAESVAAQARADGARGTVCVVIDAQRGEFYTARYCLDAGDCRETGALKLASLPEVTERETSGEQLIGPEVTRWFPSGRVVFPRAATVAALASGRTDFVSGEKLEPIYLRETKFVKAPPPRNW